MILLKNITLAFGTQTIFNGINEHIFKKMRIGLFGLNGAGKSTLLKVIAGHQAIDKGSLIIEKGMQIAYMPQEVVLQSDRSILQETMETFEELIRLKTENQQLEKQIASDKTNHTLIEKYADSCHQLIAQEPERKQAECERMLCGLGFTKQQLDQPVNSLSVGWKMRIVLAQLLLKKADFYLFDEPTNHLDLVAKEWFMRFLKQTGAGFLLVCHEKQFLNVLCDNILELEHGKGTMYKGNYDSYIHQKEEATERILGAYEQQQREIDELEKTINRFRAGTRAKQAKSMEKRLDKIERIVLPTSTKKVSVRFPLAEPSGRLVLDVKNIGHAFGQKQLFQNCSFTIERNNKIAIVAPNGAGKTTLINIIMKKITPLHGSLEWGNNVTPALFDQDQLKSLDLNKSVFENATSVKTSMPMKDIRTILGSFLFDSNALSKTASVLSGGERNRLGMIRVLLQNANFLMLDEPTNHLDIPSKEILLEALINYQGTILFVSHDQDFVNRLATHILELNAEKSFLFAGSYDEYLYQKDEMIKITGQQTPQNNESKTGDSASIKKESLDPKEHAKKIHTIEQKIAKQEALIKKIELSFEKLEYGTEAFAKAQKQLLTAQKELETAMHEWERLVNV